jgi:serine acetyltransferase
MRVEPSKNLNFQTVIKMSQIALELSYMKNYKRLDVLSSRSEKKGFFGFLESSLRRFRTVGFMFMLSPIALIYILCIGLALTPGIMLVQFIAEYSLLAHPVIKGFSLGCALACSFLMYGLSIIFIVPLFNKMLLLKVKPHRASWYSLSIIPWYYHNALTYLVRYTFLDFITPTPLNKLFYQMMGMKIGKGSMINTSNISDPCLIEIGDYVTIGGSATLVAHYGMKGLLIIDKLIIKDRATIGLKASLFGDVVVGSGATIAPNEVLLPKTRIPDIEVDDQAA